MRPLCLDDGEPRKPPTLDLVLIQKRGGRLPKLAIDTCAICGAPFPSNAKTANKMSGPVRIDGRSRCWRHEVAKPGGPTMGNPTEDDD